MRGRSTSFAGAPRVFLTGASSGLGEALALQWAHRHPGVRLGLVARRAEALERVAAGCEKLGATVGRYAVDVMDRAALAQAAGDFEDGGLVDVVVANAGISSGTLAGEPDDADALERIVRTNLLALTDTFAAFAPGMRRAGYGTLVGIASVAGIRGLPGAGAYSASKAAAIAWLESARIELSASGLRVVTIAPGYVRTPMTDGNPYPMPFLMEPAAFAERAVDAIERGARYATIPWQMGVVSALLRTMPRPLFDAAMRRAPRKPREGRRIDRPARAGDA